MEQGQDVSIGFGMVRLLPNGTLDSTFGTNGKYVQDQYPDSAEGTALALAPDGSILVSGWDLVTGSGQGMAAWKITSTGALDSSFGAHGEYLGPLFAQARANAITFGANGDAILAGATTYSPSTGATAATLVALTAQGIPDSSFGDAGTMTIPDAGYQYGNDAYAIVGRQDGSFLVGTTTNSFGGVILHVTSRGALDTTFGSGGYDRVPAQHSVQVLTSLVLDPQGRMLITGVGPENQAQPPTAPLMIARLNSDGTIDPTFGTSGIVQKDVVQGEDSRGNAVALDSAGNVLAGGVAADQTHQQWSGFIVEVEGGTLPPPPSYSVAFQDSNGSLRSEGPGGLTNWNLGLASGTSPSVMRVGASGYEIAFQANGGALWTVGTAGWTNWGVGMAPNTSPSMVRLSNGGYELAFEANGGALWTVGTAGWTNWGVGMAPGTSPSVVALPNGGYEVAFQAYGGALWSVGTQGWTDWGVGMAPDTSPSAYAPGSGGYEIAFQANGGALWSVGSAGWTNWGVGMNPGTSPSTVRLTNGGYQIAFQAYGGPMWSIGTQGWTNWGVGMAPNSSPSITALPNAGYEIAFQAYGGELWTIGTAGWTDWPLTIAAFTGPSAN